MRSYPAWAALTAHPLERGLSMTVLRFSKTMRPWLPAFLGCLTLLSPLATAQTINGALQGNLVFPGGNTNYDTAYMYDTRPSPREPHLVGLRRCRQ
jgi:hypothetical protein